MVRIFRFLMMMLFIFLININLYAYRKVEIFLRPAEKTIIEFNKQISSVETVTGSNLILAVDNFKNSNSDRGILKIVANELFSSANFHVIFSDGSVYTFTAYADPTAKLYYYFDTSKKEDLVMSNDNSVNLDSVKYYYDYNVPLEAKVLLAGINELEKANRVYLKYKKPIVEGVYAVITRYLDLRDKIFYELEVTNFTNYSVRLNASMFSDYLTQAVSIVGMDSNAEYILSPKDKAIVYIVESVR